MIALALGACWLSDPEVGQKFLDTGLPTIDAPTTKVPTETDADADADADSDADADADADADSFACADGDLGGGVGEGVVVGDTAGAGDDLTPTCYVGVGAGGLDRAYVWTPPSSGCWAFDTLGAAFDTVVSVREGCAGAELACNDDADLLYDVATSEVGVWLPGGASVLLVVDGYDGSEFGAFDLDIVGSTEVAVDVAMGTSLSTAGNSDGADATLDPGLCPYASGADVILSWTAPASATWVFDLTGTSFDSVLSLHRPCTPDALACADGFGAGGEVLDAWFVQGETVLIRIGGWNGETGPYTLTIREG